jgi:guanosine-3',5'-bis(diphosphate) 3'-pyrophosphohydrolase
MILLMLTRGLPAGEKQKVHAAFRFAKDHLSAVKRRSGESYADHGEEVAITLRELTDDPSLLAVAVLHDLLVHPDGEELLAKAPLTDDERGLVREMHPLRRLQIDESTRDLDTALDAFTTDERLLPLRMAHRLSDVRNLKRFPPALRRAIARETLHMYTAIAGRLGMNAWRRDMEDICFRLLQPKIVTQLEARMRQHAAMDEACLRHGRNFLQRCLREQGITCSIESRIKSLYSTYRKMMIKRRCFEELSDRLALRVIVREPADCYRALGAIHAAMHPIPGKLKDYIGAPKENGYRSIHTVVYPLPGVTESPMEIQVRTEQMHRECEFGIANHGEYKNALYEIRATHVEIFRNLQTIREESHNPKQFAQALRNYFSQDHIAVFAPDNTLYHLKKPATAIDFVCHAHSKRARTLKNLRVNGRSRPLNTVLQNGDTIEPVFGREVTVKEEWLSACMHRASKSLLRELLLRRVMIAV